MKPASVSNLILLKFKEVCFVFGFNDNSLKSLHDLSIFVGVVFTLEVWCVVILGG